MIRRGRVVLSASANSDLTSIRLFLLEQGIDASERVADAFDRAFTLLADDPGIGHARPELASNAFRFWPVLSYLIVYRPASSPLQVARILHTSRDLARILEHGEH